MEVLLYIFQLQLQQHCRIKYKQNIQKKLQKDYALYSIYSDENLIYSSTILQYFS